MADHPTCYHPCRMPLSLMPIGVCDEYKPITDRECVTLRCCRSCEHYRPADKEPRRK